MSEFQTPFSSDFSKVWISVVRYSDIHCRYSKHFCAYQKMSHSKTVWISDRCLKSEPFCSDFRPLVDRLDQPNIQISDVYSITEQMSEIQTSKIQTKFCLVFQTERSDFGHLLYSGMPKSERLDFRQRRNLNKGLFEQTIVWISVVRFIQC